MILAVALVVPMFAHAADVPIHSVRGFIASPADGTPIVYNLILPDTASASNPVPAVMRGHGWGGKGETDTTLSSTARALLNNGYAVLTWDSRGFGASGGEANVDDPDIEGRDAKGLVDLLASTPEIAQSAPGNPIVGMTGVSYAGGIQYALASQDSRIDAIAPEITWNDLRYSLFPNDVTKLGWTQLLFASGLAAAVKDGVDQSGTAGIQTGSYAKEIFASEAAGLALGKPDDASKAWFATKSFGVYHNAHPISIPTLFLQGDVDTLFNLNEAWANYKIISATGAPTKFIAFCGGHVACPANVNSGDARVHEDRAIVTWFDKYLKGNSTTDTGTNVEYSTEDGVWHYTSTFPTPQLPGAATYITATGSGSVVSLGAPTDGGGTGASYLPLVTDGYSTDPQTINIEITTTSDRTTVVGIPHISGTVTGLGAGAHLFFKLADRESKTVLDGQAASLRFEGPLTGTALPFDLDLNGVSALVDAGHHIDLQISTSSLAHVQYRGAANLNILATVSIPTI
ncbi:MAG: CocE/NonD family hydrolase [Actinomycetota bacterium]